jgi:hypothetical protein
VATGDSNDMLARIRATMPPWFPSDAPIYAGMLSGIAASLAFFYSLYLFAAAQTRIATASGGWLDLIAWDFFGARFTRRSGESDTSFRPRILDEILRPRVTRGAIVRALADLTGRAPLVFEPWNPQDAGAYGGPKIGYGVAGFYGSMKFTYQVFVTAYRPSGVGIPLVGGYGQGPSGYGLTGEYADLSLITGPVTDAEIYDTVARTVAAGVTAWTDITL